MKQRSLILNPLLAIAVTFLLAISVSPVMAYEQNGNVISITAADNGRTLDIPQGWIEVRLPENPTTGFIWGINLSPGLHLTSNNYQEDPNPAMMLGVGGTETWGMYASGLGDQKFSATLVAPGRAYELADTFVVNLHVVNA